MFVRVSDYQAQRVKSLEEAKAEIETAVKREKADKVLLERAEEDVKSLTAGKAVDVQFGEEQTLVYAEAGMDNETLIQAVFSMPKPMNRAIYRTAHDTNGDVVIVALEEVTDGNTQDFTPLVAQMNQTEQTLLRNDLLKDLRAKAKIEINEDFMNQLNSSEGR